MPVTIVGIDDSDASLLAQAASDDGGGAGGGAGAQAGASGSSGSARGRVYHLSPADNSFDVTKGLVTLKVV